MLVTVLGPDGTGKTTLAISLAKKREGLEYIYFGGSNASRKYKFFEKFIKSDLKNIFLKIIRKGLRFINDLYVFQVAKRVNMISDRCPIDNYIITKIQGRKIRYYYYLILCFLPNPNFVILLNGDPEIICKRKNELSKNEVRKYIEYYKCYLDSNKINYCTIDTVENDIKNTLRIANRELDSIIL